MEKVKAILIYIGLIILMVVGSKVVKAADIYIPEGQNFVVVEGTIEQGDSEYLEYTLEDLDYNNEEQPAHIILESGGGNLVEGVKMATVVKLSGLSTIVNSYCASACSVIFAAGYHSVIIGEGKIGLHTPYTPVYDDEGVMTDLIEDEAGGFSWWLMHGSFVTSLQDMKLAKRWLDITFITPSEEMFWITKSNADLFGITHIE